MTTDDERRRVEERLEHLAMTARLQKVVNALANHGVAARAMGGIFLRLDVAEHLVSILEDLKAIEERGSV